MIDQVRSGLCHTPSPTAGTKTPSFAGKGHQLLVATVTATQTQDAVSQDTAFQEGIELGFDEVW
jgi:hypothetical protein